MKLRKGNTVLEMLVALFILTVGLMAVIGLSFRNVTMGRESLKELQAANFAREGIEIIRNIRDSNKYKPGFGAQDKIWEGLLLPGYHGIDNSAFESGVFALTGVTASQVSIVERSDKFFIQGATPPNSTQTVFSRNVQLYAICENDVFERQLTGRTSSPACALSGGTENLIGIEIIAQVFWDETTQGRVMIVEDRLYNW